MGFNGCLSPGMRKPTLSRGFLSLTTKQGNFAHDWSSLRTNLLLIMHSVSGRNGIHPLVSGCSISHLGNTCLAGAIRATKDLPTPLNSMANDAAMAVGALGRQPLNCAFEAVKSVTFPPHFDAETLVIIVTAHFTLSHGITLQSCTLHDRIQQTRASGECMRDRYPGYY